MEIGAFEAKTRFSRLLARVAKGERITITKHGQPVADLVPHRSENNIRAAVEEMLEFRKGRKLNGLKIRDLINEGRR